MESYIRESLKIQSFLDELMNRHENKEIEFKSAHGGFSGSFWESYSSFANTDGGIILFGVKEKNGVFRQSLIQLKKRQNFERHFSPARMIKML